MDREVIRELALTLTVFHWQSVATSTSKDKAIEMKSLFFFNPRPIQQNLRN